MRSQPIIPSLQVFILPTSLSNATTTGDNGLTRGHDILMATMLNGAAIMDGASLLIAANESCPQPQTSEHLAAIEIMRLQHIIILQNKVDLIQENVATNQHEAIQNFIQVICLFGNFENWKRALSTQTFRGSVVPESLDQSLELIHNQKLSATK